MSYLKNVIRLWMVLFVAMVTSVSAQQKTELVLANSQWLDALRGEALWNAMKIYEQRAADVELRSLGIPSKDFGDRLMTEFGAGQGADIAIVQEGVFFALADAGLLIDVGAAAEGVAMNNTADNAVIDGVRYGVPWQRAAYGLIYNANLTGNVASAPPASVAQLIENASAVQKASSGAIGFTARHQVSDFSGFYMDFQNWAFGHGAHWVDEAGNLTINTPQAVEAVRAFKQMYDAKILPLGDDMPTQRTRFKEGQVAYSIDNAGGTLNIASGGTLAGTDIHAAPLPFPQAGAHQQIYVVVNANSKNQQAAIDFIKWLVSEEGQAALRKASGPDRLATDVPLEPDFIAKNPWAPTFAELANETRSVLIPGYETETLQIMRPVMEAVEEVLINNTDPQEALSRAQERVDRMF